MLTKLSRWGIDLSLSNIWAIIDKQYVELKTPAHPQGLSFWEIKWGAVSLPKKNFLFPLIAALISASLWSSLFIRRFSYKGREQIKNKVRWRDDQETVRKKTKGINYQIVLRHSGCRESQALKP